MTKTTIRSIANNRVEISFDDALSGDRVVREYSAASNGGYVYDQNEKQVCDRLSSRGSTLRWNATAPLADLIRCEYRAMRASEKREEAKYA
jgi:hypothetical protein